MVSNGEFNPPPQSRRQKQLEERIEELADLHSAKQGLDRREFLRAGSGMAAAFLAMNEVYGDVFKVSGAEAADREIAVERPSPNSGPRPPGGVIDMLVLHYTGMRDAASALDRLCDPQAKVSAHYAIDEDGTVYRLVPETRRAWHAGVSAWGGETDINDRSIGVELVNPGHEHGYRAFPEAQMAAVERLAADIVRRHRIPPQRVVGHSDVAPARKRDPGELFDWPRLARAGAGLWPSLRGPVTVAPVLRAGSRGGAVSAMQSALAAWGYGLRATGEYDDATVEVAAAFQRHFRPRRIDGAWDGECAALLRALLAAPDSHSTPRPGLAEPHCETG